MRIVKCAQNSVLFRVKAHYCALYRFRARVHYYGSQNDMSFDEIFYQTIKSYTDHVFLSDSKIKRIKKCALEGI